MPATAGGKGVATLLILAGIGTFGYAAGMVTTWLRDPDEDETLQRLAEIDRKLELLVGQVEAQRRNGSGDS